MRRRTEEEELGGGGGEKEEEASKCYFRNSFCPFMSVFVHFCPLSEEEEDAMRMGRRRTEKELYMRGLSRTEEEEDD